MINKILFIILTISFNIFSCDFNFKDELIKRYEKEQMTLQKKQNKSAKKSQEQSKAVRKKKLSKTEMMMATLSAKEQ